MRDLIRRGAAINSRSPEKLTALSLARRHGHTAMVDLLLEAGATEEPTAPASDPPAAGAGSVNEALSRALPLLQQTEATFRRKGGCISCHHNSLPAMAVAAARSSGVPVNTALAVRQTTEMAAYLEVWRDRVLQGRSIPGRASTISQILAGLAAAGHAPDEATDAMVRHLLSLQRRDGSWPSDAHRPPSTGTAIQITATSLRALKHYAPAGRTLRVRAAIDRAGKWLRGARCESTEDRAFQVLGLTWWGRRGKSAARAAARVLLAEQRPDGGWAQMPTMTSDAHATGEAIVALVEAGALRRGALELRRGLDFLMATQKKDGSWHVKTRAVPFQTYFESGFPHGPDQWISAAATSWAAMALARTVALTLSPQASDARDGHCCAADGSSR